MKIEKVALVHDYLVQYGGAEKTLEAFLELFPHADIFTGIYTPNNMSDIIRSKKVFYPQNGFLKRFPKYLTFLMPFIFEHFDLRGYDLVISDGAAWSKGVLTKPDQIHISYIHSPPRFLYGYSVESQKRNKWYFKPFVTIVDFFLRIWDFAAAQRPDYLLTNAVETQKRILKFYKRSAIIIYPPVEVVDDQNAKANLGDVLKKWNLGPNTYYLLLGRLAAYKNFDIVIKAFNDLGFKLVVAGTGAEEQRLRELSEELANTNVIFTGKVVDKEKVALLKHCKGLINPVKDEEFGIVPIEAMAFGKPVLAHKSGGHLETVVEGLNGMFFDSFEISRLAAKIKEFDKKIENGEFDSQKIKESAQKYGKERFKREFMIFVEQVCGQNSE